MERLTAWASAQATWRNITRCSGLGGMMWLVLTREHPDPYALGAMGFLVTGTYLRFEALKGGRDE